MHHSDAAVKSHIVLLRPAWDVNHPIVWCVHAVGAGSRLTVC